MATLQRYKKLSESTTFYITGFKKYSIRIIYVFMKSFMDQRIISRSQKKMFVINVIFDCLKPLPEARINIFAIITYAHIILTSASADNAHILLIVCFFLLRRPQSFLQSTQDCICIIYHERNRRN